MTKGHKSKLCPGRAASASLLCGLQPQCVLTLRICLPLSSNLTAQARGRGRHAHAALRLPLAWGPGAQSPHAPRRMYVRSVAFGSCAEAEPQISHWRQLLEQARLEKSLVPDIEDLDSDKICTLRLD